jgi:hypothetical protein
MHASTKFIFHLPEEKPKSHITNREKSHDVQQITFHQNPQTLSKFLERQTLNIQQPYLGLLQFFQSQQSGFRQHHSMTHDIAFESEKQSETYIWILQKPSV